MRHLKVILRSISIAFVFLLFLSTALAGGYNPNWPDRLSFSGDINAAAFVSDVTPTTMGLTDSTPAASDLAITFANFEVNAIVTDWLAAESGLSYQQRSPSFVRNPAGGGDVFFVDKAFVTIAQPSTTPFYAIVGRKFIPFGGLDSVSLSESTFELMTINRQTIFSVGVKDWRGANASVFVFRGANDAASINTTRLKVYGASVGYGRHQKHCGFDARVEFVSDILSGLYTGQTSANGSTVINGLIHSELPAVALHVKAHFHEFDVDGKYVTAVESASVLDVPYTTNSGGSFVGAEPSAWGVNGGYTFDVRSYKSRISVGYQGSREAVALGTVYGSRASAVGGVYGTNFAIGMPRTRFYTNYSIQLANWVKLAAEYAHDIGYGASNGGTGRSANIGVLMLSTHFA